MDTENAKPMKFELVMPSALLLSSEADYVSVSGEEGEFGVLPGHMRLVSTLKPGPVVVRCKGRETVFCVGYGLADVGPEGVTVLAQEAVEKKDLKPAELKSELAGVEKEISRLEGGDQPALLMKAQKRRNVLTRWLEIATP